MSRLILFALVLGVVGCQSARTKDVELVKDRILKLKPLSEYASTVCKVEAEVTQPALARFEEMHPKKAKTLSAEAWTFRWRQWESRCEIAPSSAGRNSPVIREEQQFLANAMCVLAQIFFVNSPFDELKYGPEDVHRSEDMVRIGEAKGAAGIFLDPADFKVTTKTKSRGEFSAHYSNVDGEWLPDRIDHVQDGVTMSLSEFEYGERLAGRRVLKSALLSMGHEQAFAHTRMHISMCERL